MPIQRIAATPHRYRHRRPGAIQSYRAHLRARDHEPRQLRAPDRAPANGQQPGAIGSSWACSRACCHTEERRAPNGRQLQALVRPHPLRSKSSRNRASTTGIQGVKVAARGHSRQPQPPTADRQADDCANGAPEDDASKAASYESRARRDITFAGAERRAPGAEE